MLKACYGSQTRPGLGWLAPEVPELAIYQSPLRWRWVYVMHPVLNSLVSNLFVENAKILTYCGCVVHTSIKLGYWAGVLKVCTQSVLWP
jgi:hypothetical protein